MPVPSSVLSRVVRAAGVAAALYSSGCAPDMIVPIDIVQVEVTAHRADWEGAYLVSGETMPIRTGREVHLPLGADVTIIVSSREYISNFFAPDLGLREFAAPGLPGYFRFRANQARRYELRAEELCGLPHPERLVGAIVIESPDAFQAWVREQAKQEL